MWSGSSTESMLISVTKLNVYYMCTLSRHKENEGISISKFPCLYLLKQELLFQ